MEKKTRSLLEELESIGNNRDINHIIEGRANNIITSAINLIELMRKQYDADKAALLERKLLSAIKGRDAERFTKTIRKTHEN